MNLDFEWDDIKAGGNIRNHGVSFAHAALAFRDPFAVEWIDLRKAYGEGRIRIISARRASKNEQEHYYRQNAP
jgi:uncharacterized DUF497 family protein